MLLSSHYFLSHYILCHMYTCDKCTHLSHSCSFLVALTDVFFWTNHNCWVILYSSSVWNSTNYEQGRSYSTLLSKGMRVSIFIICLDWCTSKNLISRYNTAAGNKCWEKMTKCSSPSRTGVVWGNATLTGTFLSTNRVWTSGNRLASVSVAQGRLWHMSQSADY